MRRVGRGVVHLRRSGRIRRVCRFHHEMVRQRRKSEVTPQNKNMKTDVPPGRYGHTATISGDYMYIFGGQGRYGAMNDLWVFDFVRATWSPLDSIGGSAQGTVWALRMRF